MIQRLFGDKAPYQLLKILRYLGFSVLCILICVGFVTEIKVEPNGLMKQAIVKPFVDFDRIEEVLVLTEPVNGVRER